MLYKGGERVIKEDNYILSHAQSDQLTIERTFEVDNATFTAERTIHLEILSNNPITALTLDNHNVVVSYQDGQAKVYPTQLKHLSGKIRAEYKDACQPQISLTDTPTGLTYCIQNGVVKVKAFEQELDLPSAQARCVGLFRLNKEQTMGSLQNGHDIARKIQSYAYKIVALYDDYTIKTMTPLDVKNQLADMQKAILKIQLEIASDAFKKEVDKMSPTKMTPDNYRVKIVMQTLHSELSRLAKPSEHDIWDFQEQQQARDTLVALTQMAHDSNKADQPIAYKPPKKPITNLKIGSLLAIGTAVLLGATVAVSVVCAMVLGPIGMCLISLAMIPLFGTIATGIASGHYLNKARQGYTLNNNINRFTAFARSPDTAPEKPLPTFSRLAK